jgi:hypothetical protein
MNPQPTSKDEEQELINGFVNRHADIVMDDCNNEDVTPRCDCHAKLAKYVNQKCLEARIDEANWLHSEIGRKSYTKTTFSKRRVLNIFGKRHRELQSQQKGDG